MSKPLLQSGSETLLPAPSLALPRAIERLNAAEGVVYVTDLEYPLFDPERVTTMAEYAGTIGVTIADSPRESKVKDSPLQLFGKDFDQARPENLTVGLYSPHMRGSKKSVALIGTYGRDFKRSDYPGDLPFDTGVTVSEDVYEELLMYGEPFSSRVDNRTQRNHQDEKIVEDKVNLAGESVAYAHIGKHEGMEARDQYLIERHKFLYAVHRGVESNLLRRVASLEQYHLESVVDIMEMIRVACKGLGYGTNQTRSTLNAAASNLHRSSEAERPYWWLAYTKMAMRYNQEVRGKIGQSIHVCMQEIANHLEQASNNLDRVYDD